jgi:dCMP deaminase
VRPSIDEYYTRMVSLVATRGTCPRRQVGAVLVDNTGKLVATGYNGPPAGMDHCIDVPCPGTRDTPGDNTRCVAVHAEANAVLQAASSRREPHTLYCSCTPCFSCAKLLITAGVKEIVAGVIYQGDLEGLHLLDKAGIPAFILRNGTRIPWSTCVEG